MKKGHIDPIMGRAMNVDPSMIGQVGRLPSWIAEFVQRVTPATRDFCTSCKLQLF
jgi:hypothetical protein